MHIILPTSRGGNWRRRHTRSVLKSVQYSQSLPQISSRCAKKKTHFSHILPPPLFSLTNSHSRFSVSQPLMQSIKICLPSRVPSPSSTHSPLHPCPIASPSPNREKSDHAKLITLATHMYFLTVAYPAGECGLFTFEDVYTRVICGTSSK